MLISTGEERDTRSNYCWSSLSTLGPAQRSEAAGKIIVTLEKQLCQLSQSQSEIIIFSILSETTLYATGGFLILFLVHFYAVRNHLLGQGGDI